LLSGEEFTAQNNVTTTVGEFVEKLLSDTNYFNTVLPRTPILIQREILRKLMTVGDKRKRRDINEMASERFKKGSLLEVQWAESGENWDATWVKATVTKVHWRAVYQVDN
jgi:hypothetical protein